MGKGSSAKKKLSLKTDFIPAKFVLFILPFVVEAITGLLTMGSADTVSVLIWSMLLFLFGIGIFPLTAKIFNKFGSGGFIISQALGVILTSLLIWTFTYIGITRFNLPCVIGGFALLSAVCWGLKPLRETAVSKLTEPFFVERAVIEELAFLVIFCLMCYFKGFLPYINGDNGQEKYMDYGFIMSMLRNDRLPANDMWLAGKSINYYYFGQFMWALVIKCSFIKPSVAYNIAMCCSTALPFAMSFSFGTMLIETAAQHGFHDSPLPKYLSGTLTGFAVSLWGNSHSFFYDPDSFGHGLLKLFEKMGFKVGDTKEFFYPDSTRYIGHNPVITENGGDYTIEEFPFYSYLIGDLHAHVISMMLVILIACLLLALINSASYPDSREMKVFRSLKNIIPQAGNSTSEFKVTLTLPFIMSSVLLGVAQMTNYWDFLIYFIFGSMAVLIVNTRMSKVFTDIWGGVYFIMNTAFILSFYLVSGSDPVVLLVLEGFLMVIAYLFSVADPCALTRTSFQMSFVFTAAHLVALPFNLKFEMISNSLGKVKNTSDPYQLFILWGTHVIICLVFFVWIVVTKNYKLTGSKKSAAGNGNKDVPTEDPNRSGWTNPIQKFFGTRNIADVFVCGIIVVGILFLIAPEIFYVRDIYTEGYLRSNTMFKFTFAAFIMLSEAMCYAATRLIWFITRKGHYSTPALIAGFISIILMVIPAHYTLVALKQRSGATDKEFYQGLDGTAFIEDYSSDECYEQYEGNFVCYLRAAEWFNANVKGAPVICEGYGESYSDSCVISAYTGLPTVFGWQTHEWLWRFHGVVDKTKDTLVSDPDNDVWVNLIAPRQREVDTIYEENDEAAVRAVIDKYKIEYIVLGSMEYAKFGSENTDLFYQMFGEPVFTYDDLLIFKTTPSQGAN
ncbi:MAG: hypothetical protein J5777_00700 [Clostridiales bacterium]|nr:hypothetical protein [Clostridiales bacterium]